MNIHNKVCIITGGASGMGLACARLFQSLGAKVAVWDMNLTNDADLSLEVDVRSDSSVTHALEKTIESLGVPTILISCAGIAPAKKIIGKQGVMPLDDFKRVIDVNLVGTFNVMRVVADAMAQGSGDEDEQGVIINTASIAAWEGQVGQTAYSASKGGVIALTLPAARELAKNKIRVNCIAPGLIATPMLLNMPQEVQDSLAATVTFPKRLGKPEEFASLARHIVENSMINGEVIRLDGALRMQAN